MEEIFTRDYIAFLYEMQDKHISALLVEMRPSVPFSLDFMKLKKEKWLAGEEIDDKLSPFKSMITHSSFLHHATMLNSNISGETENLVITSNMVDSFKNSLPTLSSYLSSDLNIDEALNWLKLAVKFANCGNLTIKFNSTWAYILGLFIWKRDYASAMEEGEKFIKECNSMHLCIPAHAGNVEFRRNSQMIKVRIQAILMQYRQHLLAGLESVFFPGQLVQLKIGMLLFMKFVCIV